MKLKRILILTVTLTFLVSTTGMPVTYHLCQMMQEKSLSECQMCAMDEEKIQTSCCNEETTDNAVTITSENPVCCQSEFVYNKVEDEFVNQSSVNFFSSSEILFQPIVLVTNTFDFSPEISFYSDSSPPFLINHELHITNSVLLI